MSSRPVPNRLSALAVTVAATTAAALVPSAAAAPAGGVATQMPAASRSACDAPSWAAAWALPASDTAAGYDRQTVRVVAIPNFGGRKVRVRLSNALGNRPVTLTNAHVGLVEAGTELVPGSNVPVTFDGRRRVTIPPGRTVRSDPTRLRTRAFAPVAVSFYAPAPTGPATGHGALATTYVAGGNKARRADGSGFDGGTGGGRLVAGVDVFAPNDGVIVALGDSITEGFSSDRIAWGEPAPWTDTLAQRLHARAKRGGPRLSLVNVGISGNRVLEDGTGPSAIKRLRRDVLSQSGLAGVIMMEGINDLAPFLRGNPTPPTLRQMSAGYRNVIDRVRRRGAQIWISPLTPAGDTKRPTPFTHSITPAHVERRHEINSWIRSNSGTYDGRVDFEPVVMDPLFPNWIAAQYDSGDNLHPNNAGLAAMGESVKLSLFNRYACRG